MKNMEASTRRETLPEVSSVEKKFSDALRNGTLYGVGENYELEPGGKATFDPHPFKGLRDGVSGHGVFFGQIRGSRFGTETVAVKAHGSIDDAEAEIKGGRILKKLGFETYEPYGAVKGEEGAYLLTRFNTKLVSLNELEWKPLASGMEVEEYAQQETLIKGCAEAMATLHVVGRAAHGDAQIKNFAIHRDLPGIHPIDPEKIEVTADDLERANKAVDDLKTFRDSLVRVTHEHGGRFYHGVGVWGQLNDAHVARLTDTTIVGPYLERVEELFGRKGQSGSEFIDPLMKLISDSLLHEL